MLLEAKKRAEYIWGPEIMKRWLSPKRTNKAQYVFIFFVNKSRAEAVISQSGTFETDYTQNLHLYAVCWHKQPPDAQTIQFWHQVSRLFRKLWLTWFLGTNFKGGQNFLFTMGCFYKEREYSGADWQDLLITLLD